MYVKPAPGIVLRDPITKRLLSAEQVDGIVTELVPAQGLKVDDNDMYWVRRVRDGDAVLVAQTAPSAATTQTAASSPQKSGS
ncbi:DUF2635 domain-containing protein [Burkholderia sp. BC1]|uniref:DUF2635 domain-containing protein n=1 Tax=Burkholderia sp. BC1 TaxID=1095370 RepID=UPI0040446A03